MYRAGIDAGAESGAIGTLAELTKEFISRIGRLAQITVDGTWLRRAVCGLIHASSSFPLAASLSGAACGHTCCDGFDL